MGKVISIKDKLEKNKKETIKQGVELTKEVNKKDIKKSKLLTLNDKELFCLIECLIMHLKGIPNDLYLLVSDDEENTDEYKEEYLAEAKMVIKTLKRLIKKFLNKDGLMDYKVKVTFEEISLLYDALGNWVCFRKGRDELHDKIYFKKDYDESSEDDKIIKYLYIILKEYCKELNPINFELNEEARKVIYGNIKMNMDQYDEILAYYKSEYEKEYKSKITLICEGLYRLWMDGKPLQGTGNILYYVKPTKEINKRWHKYKTGFYECNRLSYIDKYWIEEFADEEDESDRYPLGEGWRIDVPEKKVEKCTKCEECDYCDEYDAPWEDYYDFLEEHKEYSMKFIRENIPGLDDLEIEIFDDKEEYEEELDFGEWRIERVLDMLEETSYEYYRSEILNKEVVLIDEIENLENYFYE